MGRSQLPDPASGAIGGVIPKILLNPAVALRSNHAAAHLRLVAFRLDPDPATGADGRAWFPVPVFNTLGIKWEFGDGDPIRGQMPKPPPRL